MFGHLKTYMNQAMDNWVQDSQNANKSMSIHVFPGIVSYAFPKVFTPHSIMAGFRCTGIYPYDRSIFSDVDFMPSTISDRSLQSTLSTPRLSTFATGPRSATPGPSTPNTNTHSTNIVSPKEIQPSAKAAVRISGGKGRRVANLQYIHTHQRKMPLQMKR